MYTCSESTALLNHERVDFSAASHTLRAASQIPDVPSCEHSWKYLEFQLTDPHLKIQLLRCRTALIFIRKYSDLPFASANGASEDPKTDPDLHPGTDPQLLEYVNERAMTRDLKNRPPLFPGEEGGTWLFSSAEQIIRGEWHLCPTLS